MTPSDSKAKQLLDTINADVKHKVGAFDEREKAITPYTGEGNRGLLDIGTKRSAIYTEALRKIGERETAIVAGAEKEGRMLTTEEKKELEIFALGKHELQRQADEIQESLCNRGLIPPPSERVKERGWSGDETAKRYGFGPFNSYGFGRAQN